MAVFNNILNGASGQTVGAAGYQIERSLRFNPDDDNYLYRNFGGNQKTWTFSTWFKRGGLGSVGALFATGSSSPNIQNYISIYSDYLRFVYYNAGFIYDAQSAILFRDPSAWYHLVITFDTTQASPTNRIRAYVNGVPVVWSSYTAPAQNSNGLINSTYRNHSIGDMAAYSPGIYTWNGYIAETHFIDGQALAETDFGEFDANGVWQPIEYTGTYGTTGFYLNYSDNSSLAALGYDSSGNGNNWANVNFSVTAGSGNDSLFDSPTNGTQTDTGAGGEVSGNYCTLNPLAQDVGTTLTNGNLDISSTDYGNNTATFFLTSGKWYWEGSGTGYVAAICGKAGQNHNNSISAIGSNSIGWWPLGPVYWDGGNNGGSVSYGAGDAVGVALDMDSGIVYFYKNGTLAYTITFGSGTVPDLSDGVFPCYNNGLSSGTKTATFNFGQRPFSYSAPSGFKALCTANLDTPTIEDGSTAMDVALYTGNGSTQTISGLGFSPDLVWIKSRSNGTDWHALNDTVRGAGQSLYTNVTNSEDGPNYFLSSFTSDGFSVNVNPNDGVNTTSDAYVGWTWDAGTSTVSNTNGSITSSVRANPSAGFSVLTATVPASGGTIGHGLNATPGFIIGKNRDSGGTNWGVWHSSINTSQYLLLNNTSSIQTSSGIFNGVSSTTFTVGNGWTYTAASHVFYCWTPVEGYSSFGSYTGNGNANGPFVHTGFRPRWIMVKSTNVNGWVILDTARDDDNLAFRQLIPNLSNAEDTVNQYFWCDILSNGFKLRTFGAPSNANAVNFIYAAFAEHPFKTARAR